VGGGIDHPMNTLPSAMYITSDHWAQMEADIVAKAPEEACGFVVGEGYHSRLIIPVTNILHDAFRFRMDPEEQLRAFFLVEEKGLEILAIYHSHPHGISNPSATDYDELTFPGAIYLIWYQDANKWQCRGYKMQAQTGTGEVPVIISTNE
jgi:proteasome lid subunit RPN8/RPN11